MMSPGANGPTPDGVPVNIKSFSYEVRSALGLEIKLGEWNVTSNVMIEEICWINLGILKIISDVTPSCLTFPFTYHRP